MEVRAETAMYGHRYTFDDLTESTVRILSPTGKKTETVGSGFVIHPHGYVITCHHVIYSLDKISVEYQGQPYEAEWCEKLSKPDSDIAVLKMRGIIKAIAVPIKNPRELSTKVTIYGYPRSKEKHFEGYAVFASTVHPSSKVKTLATLGDSPRKPAYSNPWNILPAENATFLSHRINEPVDRGTSGGPVFSEALEGVVGIIQSSGRGESYVIRWNNIRGILDFLGLEPEKNALLQYLRQLDESLNQVSFFHRMNQKFLLEDQYVPIEVTLERQYRHQVETTWGYIESEEDLKRVYSFRKHDGKQPPRVSWEKAKRDSECIMVLADPGMGKSALLKMEALRTAQKTVEELKDRPITSKGVVLPIFLRLDELQKSGKELDKAIPELISSKFRVDDFLSVLEEKLGSGKCILLLDALDEVPLEHRNDLSDKINRFLGDTHCPIVCTSRIVGYSGAFIEDAKELEIVPFRPEQTEQYIEIWFNNAGDALTAPSTTPNGLIQELRLKPQVFSLGQNPLLLSLLCSLYQTGGLSLPVRRSQIYAEAVKYMLHDWRSQRERQSTVRVRAKLRLLEELAYHFTCERREVFSLDNLLDWLPDLLESYRLTADFGDAESLINELSEQDGIFQNLDEGGENYMFLHRTFQEYLSASYINRAIERNKVKGIDLAMQHIWEYEWHETLTLLAGLMNDPIPLLKAIMDEKDDIFHTLLLLACRCLAECDEEVHASMSKISDSVFAIWLIYPGLGFIRSALASLCQVHNELSERVIKNLGTGYIEMLAFAVNSLGEIGFKPAEGAYVSFESHYGYSYMVTHLVAETLGQIRTEHTIDTLVKALSPDSGNLIRPAANTLGKLGDKRAIKALIQAWRYQENYVTECVSSALTVLGGERVVVSLIQALQDKDESVRVEAAKSLGEIGDDRAIDALVEALKGQDESVRVEAAKALGKIGGERATEALIQASGEEEPLVNYLGLGSSLVVKVMSSRGQFTGKSAADVLTQILNDENEYVDYREEAAKALGKIGGERAIDALVEALKYKNESVRVKAAKSLGKIGGDRAIDALVETLKGKDESVRVEAAKALGKIGGERAMNALTDILDDENGFIKVLAANFLAQGSEVPVEDILLQALNDHDYPTQLVAAEGLVKIGDQRVIDAFTQILREKDNSFRGWAVRALGDIGGDRAINALVEALEDKDKSISVNAARALDPIGTLESLQKIVDSPDINIYQSYILPLARRLAIRYSNENVPFIPVYPELIADSK